MPKLLKKIDSSTTAGVVGGVPIATITVWLLVNVWLPPYNLTIDPPTATAFGALGALVFGELWGFLHRLFNKLVPPESEPPEESEP